MSSANDKIARFLNVDLDLYSKTALNPLVTALGQAVIVLYMGREGRQWSAHLELAEQPKSADAAIRQFSDLVAALRPKVRRLWDGAIRRDFNIGIQAGLRSGAREFNLAPQTIQLACALKAQIVVTVYGAALPSKARP